MSNIKFKETLLASTMIAGMLAATPAFAQTSPDSPSPTEDTPGVVPQDAVGAEENTQGEIVVTGTLINNPNLTSSSPVSVVAEDELELRQTNNVETVLRELPGASANLGQNVNNGSVGSARVDLRSLGANRNIVLLDGVRITPSNFSGIVDLNNIPVALIQRVDVLTGGASTTYGADAVSGVVNFITQRDFAGVELDASSQITERGDGHTFRADLTLGANFDDGRGNAVLGLGYQEADPVYFGDRDIAQFTVGSASGVASGDSATSVPTAFSLAGASGFQQVDPTGNALVPQYNLFNFNPFNIFQTPFERFNIFGAAHYEVSDDVEVYTRALFSKNSVNTIIAASGIFGTNTTIGLNNPFLPEGIRQQFCATADFNLAVAGRQGPTGACNAANTTDRAGVLIYRRTTEVGPRISEYTTTIFDYQAGFRYNFAENLVLDVYGSYGESENEETRQNYVSFSRVIQALDATSTTTCTNTANACVPLNIFGQEGSITPEMAAFVGGVTSSITNRTSLAQAHGLLSGDFGTTLPWASEPVSFAVGSEYRQYKAERRPDSLASVPGELGGAGGAILPVLGGYDVYEAFGELIVPLATDRPLFDELTLEAGIRHSKYSVDAPTDPTFDATTYKVGVNWAPVEAVRFRGNYQRAVRAPNIGELFAPVSTGLTNLLSDPCAGAAPRTNANLRAVCLAQGATAFQIDNGAGVPNPTAGQANATGGGNPLIQPEKATTYTLGVVLRPEEFVSGLTLSLDYYNIKVENAITTATPGDVIGACFNNLTAASATSPACTGIRRNALTGGLSGTSTVSNPVPGLPTPLTNNGLLKTDGIDLVVNYRRDLGFARLNWNFSGNHTMSSFFQASPTAFGRECTGFYSTNCGISNGLSVGSITPKYSWNQRTTLSFGEVDVSLLWRHISKMRYEGLANDFAARGFTEANRFLFPLNGDANRTITGRGPLVGRRANFNEIPAANYFDLAIRVNASENMEFTFTVQNLLDRDPPLVGSSAGSTTFNGGNTYPSTYDAIGRRFAAGARLRF
jgi:outer membrane receptor protein involved in Fe transport